MIIFSLLTMLTIMSWYQLYIVLLHASAVHARHFIVLWVYYHSKLGLTRNDTCVFGQNGTFFWFRLQRSSTLRCTKFLHIKIQDISNMHPFTFTPPKLTLCTNFCIYRTNDATWTLRHWKKLHDFFTLFLL